MDYFKYTLPVLIPGSIMTINMLMILSVNNMTDGLKALLINNIISTVLFLIVSMIMGLLTMVISIIIIFIFYFSYKILYISLHFKTLKMPKRPRNLIGAKNILLSIYYILPLSVVLPIILFGAYFPACIGLKVYGIYISLACYLIAFVFFVMAWLAFDKAFENI